MKPEKVFESAVEMQLSGDHAGAKTAYHKLLRSYPNNSVVLGNLAVIAKKEGQARAAEQLLLRSLRTDPYNISAMATLANLRISEKDYDRAFEISEGALLINPDHVESLVNYGIVQIHRNQLQQAETTLRRAYSLDPDSVPAKANLANLGRILNDENEHNINTLRDLAKAHPDNPDILFYLAQAYNGRNEFIKCLETLKAAIDIEKREDFQVAYANTLVSIGEFEEAIEIYRVIVDSTNNKAINNKEVGQTFLFALNYDNRKTQQEVFDEYTRHGARLRHGIEFKFDHKQREKSAGRRIRVGYMSPDLYGHVVSYFMEPVFNGQDHANFEYFAYANVFKPDAVTARIKKNFDHWIDTTDLTDAQIAQRMYDDKLDIVVDLAGHTAYSRVRALAMRPAPVQATYLGYGYTTGLSEIDYFIGDKHLTPDGCDPFFSERVMRIESPLYAYQPPVDSTPNVADVPALKNGYITFGSMSRIVRFNNDLLRVWKILLDQVPNSRLRLDQKAFEDPALVTRFLGRLESLGFSRDQVDLVSTRPHWHGYHQFDISLDCWPHNAGTTTFESLWMGVPVVSKRDRPSVGRLGEMVLAPLGLSDWVVDTEEEFIAKAVDLASDIDRLSRLRFTLRERIINSPFTKYKDRTKALENAYRRMITNYEADHP